jgi:integrase
VAAITQDQIEKFTFSMSNGSARTILALLSSIFSFGIKKKLLKENPCKGVVKPKDNRKTRRLSVAEYAKMGEALNGSVPNDIFLFLAVSGWRSSEARLLKYSELDLERRIATLGHSKTGISVRPLVARLLGSSKGNRPRVNMSLHVMGSLSPICILIG